MKRLFLFCAIALPVFLFAQKRPDRPIEPPRRLLEEIRARGVVRIVVQDDYAPFVIPNPLEGYPGIDREVSELLGEAMGVKVEITAKPLAEIFTTVGKGDADLGLGGLSSNLERARLVHFSDPYMVTTPAALLTREALPPEPESVNYPKRQYKGLSDLKYIGALTLGVRRGTTNFALLNEDPEFKKHKIKPFEGRGESLAALEKREVDAIIADDIYIKALLLKRPELLNKFLPLTETYLEDHISIAIRPGDAELIHYINFFVKESRRTGRMQKITKRYFESGGWFR